MNSRKWYFVTAFLLLGAVLVLQLFSECGGESHVESNCFLILYNFTPDLLKTVFDPLRTDWNLYQSRELSYFIDSIDAGFIGWCIRHKMAHFYSLSAVLSAVAILVIQQWGFAKGFPRLNPFAAIAISLIWQLTPCNFSHSFFRCGKPLTALGVTALLFSIRILYVCEEERSRKIANCILYPSMLLLAFIDRQGVFLLASATFFSISARCFLQEKSKRKLFASVAVSGVCCITLQTLCNVWITPAIINRLNGYTPSFEYQQMPLQALFDFKGTIYFLHDNIGFWFSGFAEGGIYLLVPLGIALLHLYKKKKFDLLTLIIFIISVLSAMANLMMYRHKLLMLDGVLRSGYFMPFAAVLIFVIALIANAFELKRIIFAFCLLVIAGQLCISFKGRNNFKHNQFHRNTTLQILNALNDHSVESREIIMPYTAWKLIDAFRGKLQGWELGGCPIKYPPR